MTKLKTKPNKDGTKTLSIDKRTESKVKNPPNIKSLKFARNLPVECNGCPYASEEQGGNGKCPKYEQDAMCVIRKDIAKMVDKYDVGREKNIALGRMETIMENETEKIMFYQTIEQHTGELNPEVTKRMNTIINLGKVIGEITTKERSVEVTKTFELSREAHEAIGKQIAQTIKITQKSVEPQ